MGQGSIISANIEPGIFPVVSDYGDLVDSIGDVDVAHSLVVKLVRFVSPNLVDFHCEGVPVFAELYAATWVGATGRLISQPVYTNGFGVCTINVTITEPATSIELRLRCGPAIDNAATLAPIAFV